MQENDSSDLKKAIDVELHAFEEAYLWIEEHMPKSFFQAVDQEMKILIARNLMSFSLQDHFSAIYFKHKVIVLSQDTPDADLRIFKKFRNYVIRYYQAFVSNVAPPKDTSSQKLRISFLYFYDLSKWEKLSHDKREELSSYAKEHNSDLSDADIDSFVQNVTPNFLNSVTGERLSSAVRVFFKAKNEEKCQYEVRLHKEDKEAPSLQIVLAWRNVPKAGFLYHLAKIISSHHLSIRKVVGTYFDLSSTETILLLSLGLDGKSGLAAWEEADIDDFLREFALIKYFSTDDRIGSTFTDEHLLTGNEAHLIRNFASFCHQSLLHADPNFYSYENVVEGFCRHPELTVHLAKTFEAKFHPEKKDIAKFHCLREEFFLLLEKLDTGHAVNDTRRKHILTQGMNFIDHTLKTNFYINNKSSFSFRLDPKYMDQVPYDRKEKFPELPYGIFFIRGMHFLGYNIRFKDLARGGFRTIAPEKMESYLQDRNTIFSEAYNLAYTQQKKNKDIPEGGAKTAILLEPFEVFKEEEEIYKKEMKADGIDASLWEEKLKIYRRDHHLDYIFASQSSFIDSLMTLINCHEDGSLKEESIVDYWKLPEYIYLGPDENMSNNMIIRIAEFSVRSGYKPGRSFMSSKPGAGINHKEFGVTSYGVNVYLEQMLLFLGIDPKKDPFTVKISGGPDGDVAGNEILNLHQYFPNTAKLLALTDVSGTIFDPEGLDLKEMCDLFHQSLPIRHYPPEKLHEGGFLLDLKTKKEESTYASQTLLWKKEGQQVVEDWISGNETNHLFRSNLHKVKTDVFIPAGGRPRTLNETNYTQFLDETKKPTSRAIIEGANLYLTPEARKALEALGVLIFKDSSCNKGGVICSSYEVLASLCIQEEEFLKIKEEYVKEVLELIGKAALYEAKLLLSVHQKTKLPLTEISDMISQKINLFKYQLLDFLQTRPIQDKSLIYCLMKHCPPLLQKKYHKEILAIPDIHKKAIISCYIASHLVYKLGLDWNPTIADVLPSIAKNRDIVD